MKTFIILVVLFGYTQSQNATIEPPPSVNCSDLVGFVPNPEDKCSNHYYICRADGVGERKFCDDPTLVFDIATEECVDADELVECQPPFEKMGPAVDCSVLGAGNFANPKYPCSSFFFTCLADNATLLNRSCAAAPHTKYDAVSDSCLFPAFVEACGGNATTTTLQPTEPTEPTTTEPLPKVNCSQGPGNYPHPDLLCSSEFFACLADNVTVIRFLCAGAPLTKYDVISDKCLFYEYVEACGGTATTQEPPETPEPIEEGEEEGVRRRRTLNKGNEFLVDSNRAH